MITKERCLGQNSFYVFRFPRFRAGSSASSVGRVLCSTRRLLTARGARRMGRWLGRGVASDTRRAGTGGRPGRSRRRPGLDKIRWLPSNNTSELFRLVPSPRVSAYRCHLLACTNGLKLLASSGCGIASLTRDQQVRLCLHLATYFTHLQLVTTPTTLQPWTVALITYTSAPADSTAAAPADN